MAHTQQQQQSPQQLVIVRRSQFGTFALLAQAFADEPNVRLVWDRRVGERRRESDAPADVNRRRSDRRADPSLTWGTNDYLLLKMSDHKAAETARTRGGQSAGEDQRLVREMACDLDAAALSDLSVLISGGDAISRKSLAHRIHRRSDRSARPFVIVDQRAFAELFVSGDPREPSQSAPLNGGTLLIEEIGDWSWEQQGELVQFLERLLLSGPNGAPEARLISGTNHWLLDRVGTREFRADLFYRLNAIHLVLPVSVAQAV